MNKLNKNLIITFFITIFFFLNISFVLSAETNKTEARWKIPQPQIKISDKLDYTKLFPTPAPCKDRPDLTCVYWLGNYINEIYKYAIGIVGILAAVVLMIGGVIWITAGGSASRISEAKSWITSSLTGLIIALTIYLILFQINPDLVKISPIGIKEIAKIPGTSQGGGVGCCKEITAGVNTGDFIKCSNTTNSECLNKESNDTNNLFTYEWDGNKECKNNLCVEKPKEVATNELCNDPNVAKNYIIDFNSVDYNPTNPNCNNSEYDQYFKSFGDPKLEKMLRAIATVESSCNPNAQSNSTPPSCGLMQIQSDVSHSCQWLKDHPKESVDIAVEKLYNLCSASQNDFDRFACYNGGPAAIAPSVYCPGVKAYECCINAGDYGTQTQPYVVKVNNYYLGQ